MWNLKDLGWISLAFLAASLFLFQVPGFHYDEAWIADLAAQIAFKPRFWPLFGMNHYTVPVVSYGLALIFKSVGFPSLELARVVYCTLNTITFGLFYAWIKRVAPGGLRLFSLLWIFLPLSVFNQRLCLEVTTVYAFFAVLVLWGFSLGFIYKSTGGLILGSLFLWLGTATHILFFSLFFSALWGAWKEKPEIFRDTFLKKGITFAFLPLLVLLFCFLIFLAQGPFSIEMIKLGLVLLGGIFFLFALWFNLLEQFWMLKARNLVSWAIHFLGAIALFFFFLFEILGVWPLSQATGKIAYEALIPGAFVAFSCLGMGFYERWRRGKEWVAGCFSRSFAPLPSSSERKLDSNFLILSQQNLLNASGAKKADFFGPSLLWRWIRSAWVVQGVFILLSVYKPTSARYWELSLLWMLMLVAVASGELKKHARFFAQLILISAILNGGVIGKNYFFEILKKGPTSEKYQWLWAKDSPLYYRKSVEVYQFLLHSQALCRGDEIFVDQSRNSTVLHIYRDFAQQQGREQACEGDKKTRKFWVGKPEWATRQQGAQLLKQDESWGDLSVFQTLSE